MIAAEEEIIHALGGLPPIGSRWSRVQHQDGQRSPIEWVVVAHRNGVAMTMHSKCGRHCKCTANERPMPVWQASSWERVDAPLLTQASL